jgi:hypothetical protein
MMSIIGLHLPNTAFCAGAERFSAIYNKPVTRHDVRTMSTTEDVPAEKVKGGGKKMMKWLLIAAGAALAVGLASAGGGGGGQTNSSSDNGTVSFEW